MSQMGIRPFYIQDYSGRPKMTTSLGYSKARKVLNVEVHLGVEVLLLLVIGPSSRGIPYSSDSELGCSKICLC